MKARLLAAARWLAFPAFYVFCLGLFGYLTFPYGRLKDRVIAEFEKRGKPGQRLEIGKLGSYWFTGVELTNVKLHLPSSEPAATFPPHPEEAGGKESVIVVDEAHVRVRILPLLIGRVRVDFWAAAMGGEIKGTAPVGTAKGDFEVTLEHVDIAKIEPLMQAAGGVPMRGSVTGKLALNAPDGKFNKANGTLELTVADLAVSDGKTKIQGMIELPVAKGGDLVLSAEAKDGVLKINKLAATGTDIELVGDGKITLKEPWGDAPADLYLRFKFTDAYRGKSGLTKSLLGEPGSTLPGIIEIQVPKMKRAKRSDGFYGWHVHGPLKNLKYDPSTADFTGGATTSTAAGKRGKGSTDSPFPARRPGLNLPLGTSQANTDAPEPVRPRAVPAPAEPAPPPPTPPPPAPPPAAAPAPPPAAAPTPAPEAPPAPTHEAPPAEVAPQ